MGMATRFAAVSIVLVIFTTGAFTFLFECAAQPVVELAALVKLATHPEAQLREVFLLRYLDAANGGQEMVRVERIASAGPLNGRSDLGCVSLRGCSTVPVAIVGGSQLMLSESTTLQDL